jgi:hypothetical protein
MQFSNSRWRVGGVAWSLPHRKKRRKGMTRGPPESFTSSFSFSETSMCWELIGRLFFLWAPQTPRETNLIIDNEWLQKIAELGWDMPRGPPESFTSSFSFSETSMCWELIGLPLTVSHIPPRETNLIIDNEWLQKIAELGWDMQFSNSRWRVGGVASFIVNDQVGFSWCLGGS